MPRPFPKMSRRTFLSSASAGTTLASLHPFSAFAAAGQAHLRIMETTDLHVPVLPFDYDADREIDMVGLARTAAHVAEIRSEATHALLVDNGDFLQGNPAGDGIAYERGMKEGDMHPIITAMNTLGFDTSTLGNHAFNYGLDFPMKSLAGAEFPVISANVAKTLGATPTQDTTLVPPYVILDRILTDGAGESHPIRIGLIGFVPPQIMNRDRRHLEGNVAACDLVATAQAHAPQMREEGAEIIVALSHSRIGPAEYVEGMENASVPLAMVEGIEALVTGHHHRVFPSEAYDGLAGVDATAGTIHGKPATMGGVLGLASRCDRPDARARRQQLAHRGSERRDPPHFEAHEDRSVTALVESDQTSLDAMATDHEEPLAYVRRAVGKTAAPLHSCFALVADDPSVQFVSIAQKWYVEQMLAGTEHADLPVLSAAAPFKAGGPEYYTDVPAGDVAIKNVAGLYLYLYPNTVRAVRISGAELRDWLERSVGIFNQVTPGQADQVLLSPEFPSYNFDVIDGVTYEVDLSQPSKFTPKGEVANAEAQRIVTLMFEGPRCAMTWHSSSRPAITVPRAGDPSPARWATRSSSKRPTRTAT